MGQIKIRRYIAERRKAKNLTQMQLAEKNLHYRPGNFQMGERSFPNKRILRRNLCLPLANKRILLLS